MPNKQLVLKIKADDILLNSIKNTHLEKLFNNLNKTSKDSGHPFTENQLGWARLELHPKKDYILVDEIQCDHQNAAHRLSYKNPLKEMCKKFNLPEDVVIQINKNSLHLNKIGDIINYIIMNKTINFTEEDIKQFYVKLLENHEIQWENLEEDDKKDWAERFINKKIKNDYYNLGSIVDYYNKEIYENKLNSVSEMDNILEKYKDLVKDFDDIAMSAITQFARKNGFKKIYYHEYETGKKLKGNDPPKSKYDQVPKRNFFEMGEENKENPFGLAGKFYRRDANLFNKLEKLANIFLDNVKK